MNEALVTRFNKMCPANSGLGLGTMLDMAGMYRNSLKDRPIQSVYEYSATQNHQLGARREMPGGRVFRYAKATNIIGDIRFGLKFWDELNDGITYTAPKQVQAVGDLTVWVDAGSAGSVAKDALKDGYCIIHTGTDYDHQFRMITGNTLADSDGYVTVTVEEGWTKALETGYGVECLPNPYGNMKISSAGGGAGGTPNEYTSVGGFARVKTLAANMYLWIQTWGPIFVNPHGTAAATVTADRRGLVFDREGSVSAIDESVSSDVTQQYAGFIMNRESVDNGTGPPLLMLQISP